MRSMTVEMSPEIDDTLNMIACAKGVSKGEAMRWAFALLKIAYEDFVLLFQRYQKVITASSARP